MLIKSQTFGSTLPFEDSEFIGPYEKPVVAIGPTHVPEENLLTINPSFPCGVEPRQRDFFDPHKPVENFVVYSGGVFLVTLE